MKHAIFPFFLVCGQEIMMSHVTCFMATLWPMNALYIFAMYMRIRFLLVSLCELKTNPGPHRFLNTIKCLLFIGICADRRHSDKSSILFLNVYMHQLFGQNTLAHTLAHTRWLLYKFSEYTSGFLYVHNHFATLIFDF